MKQPLAYVHPDAKIANNVVIEPFVTIDKNVIIGEGTQIGSNVTARMCHRKPGNRSQRKNHSGKQLFDYGLLTHRPRLRCRR